MTTEVETPFDIERLRAAVEWAEREAAKPKGQWHQQSWMQGKLSKAKRALSKIKLPDYMQDDPELVALRPIACGSAYCVAGNVCAAEKDAFVLPVWSWDDASIGKEAYAEYVIPKGGNELLYVRERARTLLGITEREANDLFAGENSIEDIRRIATRIANKRGEVL